MFVDSDDWVHEDFCKDAYECAVLYQAELVMFRHQNITRPEQVKKGKTKPNCPIASGYKTQKEAIDLLYHGVGQTAWNKLYHKELFHDISYPPGYLYEDVGTTYKTILLASRIYFLDKILYYHCYRSDSITALKIVKSLHDGTEMVLKQYHDLLAWGYSPEKLENFLKNHALFYCIKKKPDASDKYYSFCANILLSSKSIPANITWKRKVLYVLFKHCRPLFEITCELYDKKFC